MPRWPNTDAPCASDHPSGGTGAAATLHPSAAATTKTPASRSGRRVRRARRTPAPTASAPAAPSAAGGARAAADATVRTHHRAAAVGRWISQAAQPPASPAAAPPVRPHIITGPAAGAATTLAGSDATGTDPNVATSSGITATWAPAVVATASRSGWGPGSEAAMGGASTRMPAVAHTESWKASTPSTNGSINSTAATAQARVRRPCRGRPRAALTTAAAAMATARITEGSKRVITANTPSTAPRATSLVPGRSRAASGAARASTKATFWPDTTSTCPNPAARKSSASRGDWPRSSPNTIPVNSDRSSSPSPDAPEASRRRIRLARPGRGAAGARSCTAATVISPTMWRLRSQRSSSSPARRAPETSTRSPVRASPRSRAARPWARASIRLPWWRTVARTPLDPRGRGSSSRVTHPRTGPASGAISPASARAPSRLAAARKAMPTVTGPGRHTHTAAAASATGQGIGASSHAPSAAPAAAPYGCASPPRRRPSGPSARRRIRPAPSGWLLA